MKDKHDASEAAVIENSANIAHLLFEIDQTVPITYIIIAITALISFYAFKNQAIMSQLVMNPAAISRHKQYYRFISSGFIHADQIHLVVNMFSLYFFGPAVENVFYNLFGASGTIYFILLYILAIIVSDIPTYLKHKDRPSYNSLGASGGIAAVVFAFIIFQPLQDLCVFIGLCMPGFILGILYIVLSYLQAKKPHEALKGINHDAHLYGALFGLIFCIILYPRCLPEFVEQIKNWEVLR